MENKVIWLIKKLQIKWKYHKIKNKKFVDIFSARALSMSQKLLDIVRNKIKKVSGQLVKKQKSYSKSKNVKKMPKNLTFLG